MPSLVLIAGTPVVLDADQIRAASSVSHTGHLDTLLLEVQSLTGTIAVTGRLNGSGTADASGHDLAYENMGTGAAVAGGTDIAAAGLYRIPADNCDVMLTLSVGGSATVHYSAVHGG